MNKIKFKQLDSADILEQVTPEEASSTSSGLMSADDKSKLDNIEENANNYTLPTANSSTLGGIKIGNNITNTDGVISISKTNVTNALGYTPIDSTLKGVNSGLAELDANGKVPSSQLPSYVDDTVEGYLNSGKFYKESGLTTEITGETGKIYIDLSTNKTYRWSGSTFVEISASLALGETSSTAYRGDRGKIAYDHSQATHARTDATKTSFTQSLTSGTKVGTINIDGTDIILYAPTNTDTKVTNTLDTTTKAYITGTTTSETNTSTQIFDTGVYLGTTAGEIVATTFTGKLNGDANTVGGKQATDFLAAKSNVVYGVNYDDYKTTGLYEIQGNAENPTTNAPNGNDNNNNFYLFVQTRVSGFCTQIATSVRKDKTIYVRTCYDGTWDEWTKINDGGNAATVNGFTLGRNVPENAKFIPSGGSSGQILRWSADGTAEWGNDNNTTYSNFVKSGSGAKSGLVPAPSTTAGTTKYLREDGTWQVPPDTNTTYSNMTAATASAAGKAGLVPAPAAGKQTSFLRGDGTWVVPTNTTYSNFVKSGSGAKSGLVPAPSTTAGTTKYLREDGTWQVPPDTNTTYAYATTSANGLVKLINNTTKGTLGWTTDKGTYAVTSNTLAYWNGTYTSTSSNLAYCIKGEFGDIVTENKATYIKALSVSGKVITYTKGDGTTGTITTQDTNTTYSAATTSAQGLMSAADKTKLGYTNVAYATCATAAATAAKVVTISGNSNWALTNGSIIIVKFTYTNTASSVTLNVNSTGAKSIWYNNAAYTGASNLVTGYANRYHMYVYDGTYWVWMGYSLDANTTYSAATASAQGLVSTGAQTFAGAKTFNGSVYCSGASAIGTSQARNMAAGTAAATTTNCPAGAWYGKYS